MTPEEAENFQLLPQAVFDAIETLPFAVIATVKRLCFRRRAVNLHWPVMLFWRVKKSRFGLPESYIGAFTLLLWDTAFAKTIGLYKEKNGFFG